MFLYVRYFSFDDVNVRLLAIPVELVLTLFATRPGDKLSAINVSLVERVVLLALLKFTQGISKNPNAAAGNTDAVGFLVRL